MLAACSTGAIGIDSHFGRVNFYLSFISHLGSHINRRKTRLTFPLRVEWTDANQSMHAGFTFEISVRHRTTNRERCTVDSRFIIVLAVKQLRRIVVFLCPLDIHPEQHFSPVVSIRSAITGIDCKNGSGGIMHTIQKRLDFEGLERFF